MTELLLVGAGHTHLHLITRAAALRAAGYRVRVLAPTRFDYSGTASAIVGGGLPADAGRVDVHRLARRHAVEHVDSTLVGLDTATRVATTADGARLGYDVVSLNLGSVVEPWGRGDRVVPVKPLIHLARLPGLLREAAPAVVTVVGAGLTGAEIAAQLSARGDVGLVRLVGSEPGLLPGVPRGARRRVERLLRSRGVEIVVGVRAAAVGSSAVELADGTTFDHDVAVVATGLTAPGLLDDLGVGSGRGVPVRQTLQHVDHDDVYAVGDCADFIARPLPRVGVHGVRQAPVLVRSLQARAAGTPLPVYEPRRSALAVLDLADGTGLAVRGRWWWHGAAALRLKRRLDRRWLTRYQVPGARRGRW